jgi:hypothetical protein
LVKIALRLEALHMDGAIPATAQNLRQATSVVAIRLVPHRRQGGRSLSRVEAEHFVACLLQTVCQVLREGARLNADLLDLGAEVPQRFHDELNLSGELALVLRHTRVVDDADRHGTQRNIDTGEVLHRDLSFAGGCPASLWRGRPYAVGRPITDA